MKRQRVSDTQELYQLQSHCNIIDPIDADEITNNINCFKLIDFMGLWRSVKYSNNKSYLPPMCL